MKKTKPKSKVKRLNRVNAVVVDKSTNAASGVGATTLNDGLSYGIYPFGTRVQDEIISLNHGDAIKILGIFESFDNDTPSAPKVTLSNLNGPTGKTTDLIIGERIVGNDTGAVAIYCERLSDSEITYVLKNKIGFKEGETVTFEESRVQGIVTTLETPSKTVTAGYNFDTNQQGTFFDHSFITRKRNF